MRVLQPQGSVVFFGSLKVSSMDSAGEKDVLKIHTSEIQSLHSDRPLYNSGQGSQRFGKAWSTPYHDYRVQKTQS